MLGSNIDVSFGELGKFGFGEPQEPLGGTRVPGRGTACRGPHHTVLYLENKNPKGKPGWGKSRLHHHYTRILYRTLYKNLNQHTKNETL